MADQDTEIIEPISPQSGEDTENETDEAPRVSRAQIINIVLVLAVFLAVGGLLYYWSTSRVFVPNAYDTQEGVNAMKSLSNTTEEEKAIQEIDQMNFNSIDEDMKGLDEIGNSLQ